MRQNSIYTFMIDAETPKINKRQQLLETAERLFAREGYDAVTIRDVAKAADMNIAMITYYFGSKEKLFEEIIRTRKPDITEKLTALKDMDISPWEKITQTIDIYIDKLFSRRDFNQVVMREMALKQRPFHVSLVLDMVENNFKIIGDFIREGEQKGVFRYTDVELTTLTLIGSIFQMVNNSSLCGRMLKEEPEAVFSERNKQRLSVHLKSMLQSHLLIKQP